MVSRAWLQLEGPGTAEHHERRPHSRQTKTAIPVEVCLLLSWPAVDVPETAAA